MQHLAIVKRWRGGSSVRRIAEDFAVHVQTVRDQIKHHQENPDSIIPTDEVRARAAKYGHEL
jgi:transposase